MSRALRSPSIALFLVALVVRVAAACVLGIDGPPRGDERGYALLAESLAAGEGWRLSLPPDLLTALGLSGHEGVQAFRAPLFPLVLAPVELAGGGLAAMRVVSLLLGAACAPLFLTAARRVVAERTALAAALVYALWPPLIHLSLHALSETLSMALLLPAIAMVTDADRGDRHAAAAGALAGLAVLARPAVLLPALLLAPACGSRRRATWLAVGLALTMAPWLVRNWVVVGAPVVTTNSGVTLVGANCDAAARARHPGKWLPPNAVYSTDGGAPDLGMWGWSEIGEVASNRRFTEHALTFAAQAPRRLSVLCGWKLVRLFDPDPRSAKPDAWWKAIVGWLTVTPVFLLALVGVREVFGRRALWRPWLAPLAGTIVTALIFYGDTRMRTAADPTLILMAAAGAARLLPASLTGNSTAPDGSG